MSTLLLRGGKIEDFRALGDTGQPAFQSARQLRMVIARQLRGKEQHLAIPQRDQQGTDIDWYSPVKGPVTAWQDASEAQRESGRTQLAAFQQELKDLPSPANAASRDHAVFSRLAQWVCHFPDESHVFLVGDTPVLTFWSFIHAEASRRTNPLNCLYPGEPTPKPVIPPPPLEPEPEPEPEPLAEPAPPIEKRRSWWRRWWWLLPLLLLLLLLLLLGLRSCSTPQPGISSIGTPNLSAPDISTPNASLPSLPNGGMPRMAVPSGGGNLSMPAFGTAGGWSLGNIPWPAIGGLPNIAGMGKAPGFSGMPAMPGLGANGAMNGAPGGDLPALGQGMSGMGGSTNNGADSAPANTAGGTPPPPELEPLSIPADAEDGKATFLNGEWAAAGVMDIQGSRPLKVSYAFQQGEGDMHIRRGGKNGVTCEGAVNAELLPESLDINAGEQALCSDGSHYDMPSVTCNRETIEQEDSMANCTARYDDELFPIELWQVN